MSSEGVAEVRKTPIAGEEALANARRLIDDSKLLGSYGRVHSAILLAVLGVEETGKALIEKWGVKNIASRRSHPTHTEKQTAVFILLCASELSVKNTRRLRSRLERGTFNLNSEGGACEQVAWARKGFYEDLRMAATFTDKEPTIPHELKAGFTVTLAAELHSHYANALMAMKKRTVMELAAITFQNDLGRL